MEKSDIIELIRLTIQETTRSKKPWFYALDRILQEHVSDSNYKTIQDIIEYSRMDRPWHNFVADLCDLINDINNSKDDVIKHFQVNQEYSVRSNCNHESVFKYKVLERTAKFVTIIGGCQDTPIKRKVMIREDREIIYPEGKYSMCPILKA